MVGVTAIEETVAWVIFSTPLFDMLPIAAEITTVPETFGCAMAKPCVGEELLTVARLGSRHAHCTLAVKSFVLPSE